MCCKMRHCFPISVSGFEPTQALWWAGRERLRRRSLGPQEISLHFSAIKVSVFPRLMGLSLRLASHLRMPSNIRTFHSGILACMSCEGCSPLSRALVWILPARASGRIKEKRIRAELVKRPQEETAMTPSPLTAGSQPPNIHNLNKTKTSSKIEESFPVCPC